MIDDPGVYLSQPQLDLSIRLHDQTTAAESSNPGPLPAQSVQYTKQLASANELPTTTKRISSIKQMEPKPLEEVRRRRRPVKKPINGMRQQVFKGPSFKPPTRKAVVRQAPGKLICVQCKAKKIRVSE